MYRRVKYKILDNNNNNSAITHSNLSSLKFGVNVKVNILLLSVLFFFFQFAQPSYAGRNYFISPNSPSYGSTYSKTHQVRPYFRKNGTFVPGHLAANARSGVHCHKNICR